MTQPRRRSRRGALGTDAASGPGSPAMSRTSGRGSHRPSAGSSGSRRSSSASRSRPRSSSTSWPDSGRWTPSRTPSRCSPAPPCRPISRRRAGNVPLRIYAILLSLVGAAIVAVVYAFITDALIRSRLLQTLGRRTVPGNIRDHVIVAGLGSIGYRVALGLRARGVPVVIVEVSDESRFVSPARAAGIPGSWATRGIARSSTSSA